MSEENTSSANPLVVVAEDQPDLLQLLRRRLELRGYEVFAVENGADALKAIQERRPRAAVLDWMMPEMEGAEVCSRVKSDPETEDILVILMTARAHERDITTAFERGADEYLTKPFDIDELDQTLRRLMAGA